MKRRDIMALLGVAAAAWPLAARAQQPAKIHRLAILTHIDPVDRATGKQERYWTAFFDGLRRSGQRPSGKTWNIGG